MTDSGKSISSEELIARSAADKQTFLDKVAEANASTPGKIDG